MITDMRDATSSWTIRIILILIIASFISFYGWGRGETMKRSDIAVVNGQSISARDFDFKYQNLIQNYKRQGRLNEDIPENLQGMIKQQLLTSMIYEKIKAEQARKLGLGASDEKVKEIVKKQFSSEDNKFDFKFYEGFVRNQMGKTTGQYEDEMRSAIRAGLFEQVLLETGLASDIELKESFKRTNEKVSLAYVRLNAKNTESARPKGKVPTDAEATKFYTEHGDLFRTKEKRKMEIAFFDKKTFGGSNFSVDAEKTLQELSTNNKDMNQAKAKDPRLQVVQTGWVDYDDKVAPLTSAELTEVLNSTLTLEAGKSTVLVSREGSKVFLTKLVEVQASKLPEMATIRPQIEKAYLADQSASSFSNWVDAGWKDVLSGKTSFDAFAKKTGSTVKTIEPFTYSATNAIPEIGINEEVMSKSFAMKDKDFFTEPVKSGDDLFLIQIKSKTEPDWKKFETDHDTLATAQYQQSAQSRFMAWMQQSESKAKVSRALPEATAIPVEE